MQTLAHPMPATVNGEPLVQQGRGDSLQWVARHSPRGYTSYSVHRARTESGTLTLKWSAVSYDTGGMPFRRVPFASTPGHALIAVMALDGSSPSRIAEVASGLA